MADRQTKVIQWTINLPMDFPSDWDDDMIEFHLNESSWCCSNLISELEKYDEKNGCICGICEAKVAENKYMTIGDGKHTLSDSSLKHMTKDELIRIIRCLESNLRNAYETNDIQYENCKRLLSEERNKTLDEVLKACDIECGFYSGDVKNLTRHILMRVLDGLRE